MCACFRMYDFLYLHGYFIAKILEYCHEKVYEIEREEKKAV